VGLLLVCTIEVYLINKILSRLFKPKSEFKMKPYTKVVPHQVPEEALSSLVEDAFIQNLQVREDSLSEASSYLPDINYSLIAKLTDDTLVLTLACSGLPESYQFPIVKTEFEKYYNSDYLFFLASRIVKSLASIYPFIDETALVNSFLDLEEDEFLNVSYQTSYRLDLYFRYFSSNLLTQKPNDATEDRWRNIKSQMHLLNNC